MIIAPARAVVAIAAAYIFVGTAEALAECTCPQTGPAHVGQLDRETVVFEAEAIWIGDFVRPPPRALNGLATPSRFWRTHRLVLLRVTKVWTGSLRSYLVATVPNGECSRSVELGTRLIYTLTSDLGLFVIDRCSRITEPSPFALHTLGIPRDPHQSRGISLPSGELDWFGHRSSGAQSSRLDPVLRPFSFLAEQQGRSKTPINPSCWNDGRTGRQEAPYRIHVLRAWFDQTYPMLQLPKLFSHRLNSVWDAYMAGDEAYLRSLDGVIEEFSVTVAEAYASIELTRHVNLKSRRATGN